MERSLGDGMEFIEFVIIVDWILFVCSLERKKEFATWDRFGSRLILLES